MKKSKFLLILLILPWLTVPFLGLNAFKRYFPSALFICTFVKAQDIFGEHRGWWRFYKGIGPINSMNFFIFGPYLVSSLWMLKVAYRKFPLFLIINAINHIIFTLLELKYLNRYKIATLVNIGKFSLFMLLTIRGLLLYCFQLIIDLKKSNEKVPN